MDFGLFWINFSENGWIFEDWISDRKMDFDYFLFGLTVGNFIGHPFRGPKIVLVEIYCIFLWWIQTFKNFFVDRKSRERKKWGTLNLLLKATGMTAFNWNYCHLARSSVALVERVWLKKSMKSGKITGFFTGFLISKPDGFRMESGSKIWKRMDFLKPDSGLETGLVHPSEIPVNQGVKMHHFKLLDHDETPLHRRDFLNAGLINPSSLFSTEHSRCFQQLKISKL